MINDNKIIIPWYKSTINKNIPENIPENNVRLSVYLPDTKPHEISAPQKQARQKQESSETEPQELRRKLPFPAIPPLIEKKPQEIPSGDEMGWSLAKSIWDSWTIEQRADYLFNTIRILKPNADQDKLWKGIKIAVSWDWDWSWGNVGDLYGILALECGVIIALVILIGAGAILVPK